MKKIIAVVLAVLVLILGGLWIGGAFEKKAPQENTAPAQEPADEITSEEVVSQAGEESDRVETSVASDDPNAEGEAFTQLEIQEDYTLELGEGEWGEAGG